MNMGVWLSTLWCCAILTTFSSMVYADHSEQDGIEITVNINTATVEELDILLIGIGPAKAAAIIKHREEFGFFDTVEALTDVPGIGWATMDKNRHRILI